VLVCILTASVVAFKKRSKSDNKTCLTHSSDKVKWPKITQMRFSFGYKLFIYVEEKMVPYAEVSDASKIFYARPEIDF